MAISVEHLGEMQELSEEEAYALFDRRARELLNMSGAEFTEKWDAKALGDPDDDHRVLDVAMLMPRGW